MPAPAFRILLDGDNITRRVSDRLISLTLTDERGFEADTLQLEIDDADDGLALPPRGAKISVAIGWANEALEDKGTYLVDEVEHVGAPDRISIRARSADLRTGLTTKRQRSWHGQSLGNIVRSIAAAHSLTPSITAALAATVIDHIDQSDESDINLLTRLAGQLDAIAAVKADRLLFITAGTATTASGQPLPATTITRASGDDHRYSIADRAGYTAVKANYHDAKAAEQKHILVGNETIDSDDATPNEPSAGNTKTLRHIYASKANAERAAKAEWTRIQRGVAEFSINLATGRADLFPELPITVSGFKPEIDQAQWIATRVTHKLTDAGYTTGLDLEYKPAD